MTKPVCQCRVSINSAIGFKRCPLCTAAPDLYAACEAAEIVLGIAAITDRRFYAEPAAACRAALAKARGGDAK